MTILEVLSDMNVPSPYHRAPASCTRFKAGPEVEFVQTQHGIEVKFTEKAHQLQDHTVLLPYAHIAYVIHTNRGRGRPPKA